MTDQQNPNPTPSTDRSDAQPIPASSPAPLPSQDQRGTPSSGPTATLGELPDQPLGLPGSAGVPAQSPRAPGDAEQDAQLEE